MSDHIPNPNRSTTVTTDPTTRPPSSVTLAGLHERWLRATRGAVIVKSGDPTSEIFDSWTLVWESDTFLPAGMIRRVQAETLETLLARADRMLTEAGL